VSERGGRERGWRAGRSREWCRALPTRTASPRLPRRGPPTGHGTTTRHGTTARHPSRPPRQPLPARARPTTRPPFLQPPITALVTGCSQGGIGHALALALAATGARVFATARSLAAMDSLEAAGCTLLQLDVTDDASVAAAASAVACATGGAGIDILINNAGATFKGTILDSPPAACGALLDVNVVGVVRVAQAFAREQRVGRRG